jgi:dolichol-phosphate mannosyltransferase
MKIRWLKFAVVGTGGFVAQIAALWMLTGLGVHYVAAALMATELAIVLNFFGHESWTWRDRPAGPREALWRLLRFHGANGAISLAGAALMMPLFVELGHLHYVVANVLTVAFCSLANFVAADRVVFRPACAVVLVLAGGAAPAEAAELTAVTIEAFNRYVKISESTMDRSLRGEAPFLWLDGLDAGRRSDVRGRLARGETIVNRLETRDRGREIEAPGGLIHHWLGITFIPGATRDRVVALMQGYDRYQDIYAPNVRRSRTIARDGDRFTVYLQLYMKKVIGVVLNSEYDVRYTRLNGSREHVRSYSTRIAELRDAGTAAEQEAPVGNDSALQ